MTVGEAARRLEISERTTRDLCSSGKLAHYRIGGGRGVIRITEADLAEYLEGCRVGVRAARPVEARRPVTTRGKVRVRVGKDHFA
jgi:excisionase family DNA binding protein